ncbi:MAG: hypothetical protein WC861_01170 [Candidatus Micrarchaeia archaeon]|jgi:hypothetical protein
MLLFQTTLRKTAVKKETDRLEAQQQGTDAQKRVNSAWNTLIRAPDDCLLIVKVKYPTLGSVLSHALCKTDRSGKSKIYLAGYHTSNEIRELMEHSNTTGVLLCEYKKAPSSSNASGFWNDSHSSIIGSVGYKVVKTRGGFDYGYQPFMEISDAEMVKKGSGLVIVKSDGTKLTGNYLSIAQNEDDENIRDIALLVRVAPTKYVRVVVQSDDIRTIHSTAN